MNIGDIRQNPIIPFDIEDQKLMKLFSFFLYVAPTIDSKLAVKISESKLEENWYEFINQFNKKHNKNLWGVIASNCKIENYIKKYNLEDDVIINRRTKGFVCKKKNLNNKGAEKDYECVLRHIRNSIAHGNVYMLNGGNRKYILMEDFNKNKNKSAILFFSQTDLSNLKKIIIK